MATQNYPFPINAAYAAVAVAYRNEDYIADRVLPREPVASPQFKYPKFTLAESFTIPNTLVGRKSQPEEVEFTATEASDSVADYGLDDLVPNEDTEAANFAGTANMGFDPLARATEGITDLLLLAREKRVADLVFNATNYAAANKATLSGTTQWSDFTNSDPLAAILNVMDGMIMRPNVMVISQAVWTKLRTHPKVVAAVLGNSGTQGRISLQAAQELFEVDEIIIGRGWYNSAVRGQTVSMGRLWGKHCALICRNKMADWTGRRVTYGMTATWGSRIAGTMAEPKVGLRGSTRVRVGESVKELILANDLGYLFTNAVA